MHDCNLVFRNTFLKFLGLGLFYFYVSDPSNNSKKFHAAHHNFWRTEHDPVVSGIKQNPFLYMLGFSSSIKLETIFDGRISLIRCSNCMRSSLLTNSSLSIRCRQFMGN